MPARPVEVPMAREPADAVFIALADPTRRRILQRVADEGPLTATTLSGDLPITRQAVAKHLAQLRAAGLVDADRTGRETRFVARPDPLHDLATWAGDATRRWSHRLTRLRDLLDEDPQPSRG
jgi:DNA-binding transcriptional ArsR family regulator